MLDRKHNNVRRGWEAAVRVDGEKSRQHKQLCCAPMRVSVNAWKKRTTPVNQPPLRNERINGVDVLSGNAAGKSSRSGLRKYKVHTGPRHLSASPRVFPFRVALLLVAD